MKAEEHSLTKKYPFPFIGGEKGESIDDFDMYNRAFLFVFFSDEITTDDKEIISKKVPSPFYGQYWENEALCLSTQVFSPYKLLYKPRREYSYNFYKNVKKWLFKIHSVFSIRAVFMRHVYEFRGQTAYTKWHKHSVKNIAGLLPIFENEANSRDIASLKGRILNIDLRKALTFKEIQGLPLDYQCAISPGETELRLLLEENTLKWEEFISNYDGSKAYYTKGIQGIAKSPNLESTIMKKEKTDFRTRFLQLADVMSKIKLKEKERSHQNDFQKLFQWIFLAAWMEDRQDIVKQLRQIAIQKKKEAPSLSFMDHNFGYDLIMEGKFAEALSFHDCLLTIPYLETSNYTNALFIIQNDNTRLEINPKRNRYYLEVVLPYGSENPAIFFNASAVYLEMDNNSSSIHCLEQLLHNKTSLREGELENIVKQLKEESLFDTIRTNDRFQNIIFELTH